MIDWEFIHDMHGIAPDMMTPEIIYLTRDFLNKIPEKWEKIKKKLAKHVVPKQTVHCAIADIENLGNEFKLRGTLQSKKEVLGFHKVVVYDKDRFEDDYIGAVISDAKGVFTLAFGKKTFSDFGLESEPDIYFKVFFWNGNGFVALGKTMPNVFEKIETAEGKIVYDFGVVEL